MTGVGGAGGLAVPPDEPQAESTRALIPTITGKNLCTTLPRLRNEISRQGGGPCMQHAEFSESPAYSPQLRELPRSLSETISLGRQPDKGLLHGAYAGQCSTGNGKAPPIQNDKMDNDLNERGC